MKDFITYDLRSNLSEDQVYEQVCQTLPTFAWRRGNSDAQGFYITGTSNESVRIKLWLDEEPIAMSISFRNAWLETPDRELRKEQLFNLVKTELIPSLGMIIKVNEFD